MKLSKEQIADLYVIEHKMIPRFLFADKGLFIDSLIGADGNIFVKALKLLHKDEKYKCPYNAKDFSIENNQVDSYKNKAIDFKYIKISFPDSDNPPLCKCVYICYDSKLENIKYYTFESDALNVYFFCGWKNDAHLNYGKVSWNDNENLDKVMGNYFTD